MPKSPIVLPAIAIALLGAAIALWSVGSDLRAATAALAQQKLDLDRALAALLPTSLPSATEGAIKEIEAQLSAPDKWPQDTKSVEVLAKRLAALVTELPPRAQEELLPRLVPRRWELEALWLLVGEPPTGVSQLSNYAEALSSTAASKPLGSSEELASRLKKRIRSNDVVLAKAERADVIAAATAALKEKKELDTAARRLATYDDPEVEALLVQINSGLLSQALPRLLDGIRGDFEKAKRIVDLPLKEYAFLRVGQALMDLRLRMIAAGLTVPKLQAAISDFQNDVELQAKEVGQQVRKSIQARDADKLRKYQIWALEQIKKVQQYKEIEQKEVDKIASILDRNNPASGARTKASKDARKLLQDSLITNMAPIHQGALDEAIVQWFRKVYQDRFSHLEEAEQLELVKGFAMSSKRYPE